MPRAVPLVAVALCLLAACSGGPSPEEGRVLSSRGAILGGTPSDASQDAVVLVVYRDPSVGGRGQCTGTLIAPRLVLTARHCVSEADGQVACRADGTASAGVVYGKYKPSALSIFVGKDRPKIEADYVGAVGRGAEILDDGSKNLCNHDIGLIVLEAPITGVPIAPVRLDKDVTANELVIAVGWGVTNTELVPKERQQRSLPIKAIGPSGTSLPPNEFEVGESICSGDSGGPALDAQTGAVVGVVSRGGNTVITDPRKPAPGCVDAADLRNFFTKTSAFKELLLEGYRRAEAEPWLEGGIDPRKLMPGSACTVGGDCRSALCLPDPSQAAALTCAEGCSASECSAGRACVSEGEERVCRVPAAAAPTETTTSSCAATPIAGFARWTWFAGTAALIALAARRRQRSRRVAPPLSGP